MSRAVLRESMRGIGNLLHARSQKIKRTKQNESRQSCEFVAMTYPFASVEICGANMGGDGMNGLAMAILVACVLLLIVPALIVGWLIRKTSRGASPQRRAAWTFAGVAAGLIIGVLAVTATFYESTWSPPPRLMVNVPKDFKHEWIILLEVPGVTRSLTWQGYDLPFTSKRTEIDVPNSGVVSVSSLEGLAGAPFTTLSSTGHQSIGMGGGPGPKALGATMFLAFTRPDITQTTTPDPAFGDDEALIAYIRARGELLK
jgi:hypothetical protein